MSEVRSRGRAAQLGEGFAIALDTLRANKIRSALTILGVSVGVAVVVLLAAFITGLRSSVEESFEASGPDNFVVTRFDFTAVRVESDGNDRPPWWNRPRIVPAEATRLERLASVAEALYNVGLSATVDYEGRRIPNAQMQGYSAGWPRYTQGDFVAGRDFTSAEVRQSRAVVVLSEALAEELFGTLDPIGRRIGMTGTSDVREAFTVIGVFAPAPNIFTSVVKHWGILPYTAALKRLRVSDELAQILIVPRDSVPQETAKDDVIGMLRGMRGLRPRAENDFALIESAQILALFDRFTSIIFLGMLALTSAALMVGGVGVVGIMLISVTERTREIGIRKAVGATRAEILFQFLIEAAMLTVLGAAVGMAVGGAVAHGVAALTPLPASVPAWAVVTALVMAAVTGVLFGLVPAIRAARLQPVEALGHE